MTITEALSEINLIKKKIASKQEKVKGLLFQVEHIPDPFIKDGGTSEVLESEMQALDVLYALLIKIRSQISEANLNHSITINGRTNTIHDWLVWKREVAKDLMIFISTVNKNIKNYLDRTSAQPQFVKTKLNIDYSYTLEIESNLIETFEKLDGQLSLKNATISIVK